MLIHVGKCGGSNITHKFRATFGFNILFCHCKKPLVVPVKRADHVCIMLRDPITRYVSIFYYYFNLYSKHKKGLPIPHTDTIKKISYIFDKFKTANELAEALPTSKIAQDAFKIVPHLVFNFAFYLHPSVLEIILSRQKPIFVIRQEHYAADFKKYYQFLSQKYHLKNRIDKFLKSRRNNTDEFNDKKSLSDLAIKNLKKEFEPEYAIFKKLKSGGLISDEYIANFK